MQAETALADLPEVRAVFRAHARGLLASLDGAVANLVVMKGGLYSKPISYAPYSMTGDTLLPLLQKSLGVPCLFDRVAVLTEAAELLANPVEWVILSFLVDGVAYGRRCWPVPTWLRVYAQDHQETTVGRLYV